MAETIPSIEVAIPYVGDERLLRAAVESVRQQSDPDWTLLVSVDGPDQPLVEDWLDDLKDPRIRHRRNTVNLGVSGNFQKCLDHGSSSHVTFLGCDDRLLPTYVADVRSTLTRWPDAAAVHPDVIVIDEDDAPKRGWVDRVKRLITPGRDDGPLSGERLLTSLLVGNWTYFPATCWNREVVVRRGFRQDLAVTLDLALWADVIMTGGVLARTGRPGMLYRRHAGSASAVAARDVSRFREEVRLHREIAVACERLAWTKAARMATLRPTSRLHALLGGLAAIGRGDSSTARLLVETALR